MTTDTDIETELDRTAPDYDALVAYLLEGYGEDLRWIASFDTGSYRYDVRYIREDLKTELSSHQLDVVVHRTIGLFNRPYVEEVYTHLGDAHSLVLQHERATAVHLYLGETEGLVVKIRAGNEIGVPGFVEDCLRELYAGAD
ncbi:MAG: hypothetical protein V5A60_05625 [Haloarculaceae archaeon]